MTRSSRKGKGSEGKGERGKELSRLDPKHQKYRLGHKMGHSAHCRILLCKSISDLDSWDWVLSKSVFTCSNWTTGSRETAKDIKWSIVRIAALLCASWSQIWIPEIEYYQKVSSHAQIWPQGAEKQLSKVVVGGWWWWVYRANADTSKSLSI